MVDRCGPADQSVAAQSRIREAPSGATCKLCGVHSAMGRWEVDGHVSC